MFLSEKADSNLLFRLIVSLSLILLSLPKKVGENGKKTKSSRKIGKRRKEAVLVIKAVLLVISSRWLLALFGRWRI